jgi:hypothetical protein
MTNTKYFVVATDVSPPPANLGAVATFWGVMTAAHISKTNRLHAEAARVYRTYHNGYQAFKKLIIDAFEDPSLNALSEEIVGYYNCTSLQFVSHILTYYAMLTLKELTQN